MAAQFPRGTWDAEKPLLYALRGWTKPQDYTLPDSPPAPNTTCLPDRSQVRLYHKAVAKSGLSLLGMCRPECRAGDQALRSTGLGAKNSICPTSTIPDTLWALNMHLLNEQMNE